MPHISRYVIHLNSVHNSLLIHAPTKCEDIVVFEHAQRGTGSRNSHISNELPFVLLSVVNFTITVDLVAHKGSDDVDEVLDCADGVVSVRVVHVGYLVQDSKKVIVSVAILQIDSHMLDISTSEVNCPSFSCN